MNKLRFVVAFLFSVFSNVALGQIVEGIVTDSNLAPIPYATIFVPSLATGTTSNQEGHFELELPKGVYDVEFRSLGYKTSKHSIVFPYTGNKFQVVLFENKIELKEVRVYSGKEDPAYGIMRKAIAHAPYYFQQVMEYDAEIYLKGIARVLKMPKLLSKAMEVDGEKVKEGDTFYEESMNYVHFEAPDHYTQEVTAIKSAFMNSGEEVNPMGYINASLYDPEFDVAISPLSKKALQYYKFRYDGFYYEGDHTVNKIYIEPKRKNPEAFTGFLHIVEGTWSLHAVDLRLEPFWGFVEIKQQYANVRENMWMPIAYDFNIEGGMLGMRGAFEYHTAVKYSNIIENTSVEVPSSLLAFRNAAAEEQELNVKAESVELTKDQQKLQEILEKEELSTRDMIRMAKLLEKQEKKEDKSKKERLQELEIVSNYKVKVDTLATKRDTAFWNVLRPVPLTAIETEEFRSRDSILAVQVSEPKDSVHAKSNLFTDVLYGTTVFKKDDKFRMYYHGLLNPELNDYTAVDGVSIQQKINLIWKLDSVNRFIVSPQVGYAFSSEKFLWQVDLTRRYAPLSRGELGISLGQQTFDFNRESGMNRTVDVLSTMFWKHNLRRFYHSDFVNITNSIDLINGLELTTTLTWENREELSNTFEHSFSGKSRPYRPNTPRNTEVRGSQLEDSKKSAVELGIRYTPRQYYRIRRGEKLVAGSAYPTLWVNYQKAIPNILGSEANFQLLQLGVEQKAEMGFLSELNYSVQGGTFWGSTPEHFSDFKHFRTLQSPVNLGSLDKTVHLLDNYATSTSHSYGQVAASFTSSYIALKYLPFLSNRLFRESIYANMIARENTEPYVEVGYGITDILMAIDLGVYGGFSNNSKPLWGVKVGIKIE